VAITGALASIAVHNMAEGFGRHVTHAMLWLFVGLVVSIARRVEGDKLMLGERPAGRTVSHGRGTVVASP